MFFLFLFPVSDVGEIYIRYISQHNNNLAREKKSQNFFTGRIAFIQLKQQISMINNLTRTVY